MLAVARVLLVELSARKSLSLISTSSGLYCFFFYDIVLVFIFQYLVYFYSSIAYIILYVAQ